MRVLPCNLGARDARPGPGAEGVYHLFRLFLIFTWRQLYTKIFCYLQNDTKAQIYKFTIYGGLCLV